MKKSITTLCACLIVSIAAILLLAADWKNNTPVVVDLNVALGRGGSPCRSGGGVCSFALASTAARGTDESQGKGYLNQDGNFVLEISKATISVATSEQQFKNQKFSLPDDFEVPAEILSAVNANRNAMTLPVGDYIVEETADMYKIVFQNSANSSSFPRN